jgi:16S rRNA (guanine527-N7)-methyltransferase
MSVDFSKALKDNFNLRVSKEQERLFHIYYEELIKWNEKLNLTSITNKDEVFTKHFLDSISLILSRDLSTSNLLDVGSGAGFPSIPLKIVFPEIHVTIIDALQKRIRFLDDLTNKLGIKVTLIHGRVEEFTNRETYDIVTARAVANMRILSELCLPFVKVGGCFLAMKGNNYENELKESTKAINMLGGEVSGVVPYYINHMERFIIQIIKVKPTPLKYPRRYKKIKAKPL